MSFEYWLILVAVVASVLLAVRVTVRHRRRRADEREYLGDQPYYDEAGPGDETAVFEPVRPHLGGLPEAGTLTDMMAALRTVCPECGVDHTGPVRRPGDPRPVACQPVPVITDLPAASEYITGKVVDILAEADQWTWRLGRWEPPARIREHRDCQHEPGESCWLDATLVSA